MNSKQQSALGIASAISHYTLLGYAVFVPVCDTLRYDLIVDTGVKLLRVEVKTTSTGKVNLRTHGGNQSWTGEIKRISPKDCDVVYCYNVVSGSQQEYTSIDLEGRHSVTLH